MARQKLSKEEKKIRHNARVARLRFLKNLFIWLLGVLCIPTIIVVTTMFVPLKLFTGSDGKVVSEELSEKSLFKVGITVMSNPSEYGVEDFPVIVTEIDNLMDTTVFGETKIKDLISVDKDKLQAVKFGSSVGDSLIDCFTVTATIDSVGLTDDLGDFGQLSVFKEYTLVTETVDQNATDFNYKLYYYKLSDGSYAPAFTKNGETVTKVSGATELYYPNLIYVPLPDFTDIFSDRMGTTSVKSLLTTFGVGENNKIIDIFGDTTLKGLDTFDFDGIKLSVFMDVEENSDLYDILCAAVENEVTAETVTIGDLSTLDVDKIKLKTFLDTTANADLYKVLCDAILVDGVHPTAETITTGDLKNLNVDDIKLSSVIDPEDPANDPFYDVLLDTLSYKGITDKNDISLGDLSDFDTNKVRLATILEPSIDNESLYKILCDYTGKTEDQKETITLDNIKAFSINAIALSSILAVEDAPDLYNILEDVTGKTAENILISDLDDFGDNMNRIKLSNVLTPEDSADLYTILEDVTGKDANDIILSDLKEFDVSDIKLSSVIKTDGGNSLLKALLEKDDVTVGNIGENLDSLSLYEIYGEDAFTTTPIAGARRFNAVYEGGTLKGYTANASGTHYLNTGAGIWLVLCYDVTEYDDETGEAKTFTINDATVNSLNNGTDISSKFKTATIRHLIDAGILEEEYAGEFELIYTYTLTGAAQRLVELLNELH